MNTRRLVACGLGSWLMAGCGAKPTPPPTEAQSAVPSVDAWPTGAARNDVGAGDLYSQGTAAAPSSTAPEATASNVTSADRSMSNDDGEAGQGLIDYDALAMADGPGHPSQAVERELTHLKADYQELPALLVLPDFLSVNDVLASLPVDERDTVRDELHAQLQNRDAGGRVLGAYLDSEERYFMLWVPDPVGLSQVLTIYNFKGVLVERRHISRGRPRLRNILDLESAEQLAQGYATTEVFIERITTMSVCCLPSTLEVYALGAGGKLRQLLTYPEAHTDVGPGVSFQFLNHFEFDGLRLRVSSVVGANTDEFWDFEYQKAAGRYLPVKVTASKVEAAQAPLGRED